MPVIEEQEELFREVACKCEVTYPDGEAALLKFIYANLQYPKIAKDKDVQGTVLVGFVVEKDGSITDREVIQDIGAGCGAEALRLVYLMPRWSPGMARKGRPKCQYILPVEFILKNGEPIRPTQIVLESKLIPAKSYDAIPDENEIFKNYVDYPPMLAGCEEIEFYSGRKKCTETKMLQFMSANIKYPKKARRKKIQGTVYVKFVIEKDGSISNLKLMSEIGGGCGEEALRVVSLMPKFIPGKHRGNPIRFQYELPIKFSLD